MHSLNRECLVCNGHVKNASLTQKKFPLIASARRSVTVPVVKVYVLLVKLGIYQLPVQGDACYGYGDLPHAVESDINPKRQRGPQIPIPR